MSGPINEQKLLALCDAVRDVDDQLGGFSDYEGAKDGPTYSLWNEGVDHFEAKCDYAISLHKEAIAVWRKLQRLNQRRSQQ